jgi:hypothetical protein
MSFLGRFAQRRFIVGFVFGVIFFGMGLLGIFISLIGLIWGEVAVHNKYGKDWVQVYEKYNGPLAQTDEKIGVGIGSLIAICLLAWWGYRHINSYKSNKRNRARRRSRKISN